MGKQDKTKSLAKNAIFNILYKVMNIFFPLITTIYISHILMATGVGKVSAAQNIVQYFVLLAPLGMPTYGTREIAKIRASQKASNKLFSELFAINLISSLICCFAYYSMVSLVPHFHDERMLYLVAGLPILFNIINVEWYYQGKEDYVYIALRSIAVKGISLLCILVFVNKPNDYVIYAFIYTLGIAGNYIFNVVNLKKYEVKLSFTGLRCSRHLKSLCILLCSSIAIELYTLLDTTMLGIWCEDNVVGYYTNSIKLVRIVVILIAAIGGVLLPRISYYIECGRFEECNKLISTITQIIFLFAVPLGIGLFLLADDVVWVMFGETFMPAVLTVRIATILIYVLGFSNLFGTQVLLSFSQEKKLLICTCSGAISNIAMNSILIPIYQHNGAVVASVVSESIVTLLTIWFVKKYIVLDISLKYYAKVIFSGFIMGAVVFLCHSLIRIPILAIGLSVLIGACVYFIVNIILKNQLVLFGVKIIRNKVIKK